MLSDTLREQARTAIVSRFKLRDEVLEKELDDLAARAARGADADDYSRLGIKLRLICEHDLFERAFIVWTNLRKAHEEHGGGKGAELIRSFREECRSYMRDASLSLAQKLRDRSDQLAPAFRGRMAINADWIARLRDRALEQHAQSMEDYVEGLSWGFRSLVTRS